MVVHERVLDAKVMEEFIRIHKLESLGMKKEKLKLTLRHSARTLGRIRARSPESRRRYCMHTFYSTVSYDERPFVV